MNFETSARSLIVSYVLLFSSIPLPVYSQTPLSGTWKGEIVRNGYSWNVEMRLATERAEISFPDWGMSRLRTEGVAVSENAVSFKILWLDRSLTAELKDGTLDVNWNDGEGSGKMYRSSSDPGFFAEEAVAVRSFDGAELHGTLYFPKGEGPFRAMVITHGSGPDTRSTGPYIGKAMLAGEHGLAVLAYDKRGAGMSKGEGAYKIENLSADAHAMVSYLKKHPRIRREQIGIGGISQGAWVAPKVAYEDPEIAFVFVTATPGISPAEQNVYTLETRFQAAGEPPEKTDFAKRALRTLYEFYRTGDPKFRAEAVRLIRDPRYQLGESEIFKRLTFTFGGDIAQTVDVTDWATMFVDPLLWWSEIKVSVASFSGAEDMNVPTKFSNGLIKTALIDAGNRNFELHLFPNAGHGLTIENGPEGDWPRMAPGYVPMMADWFRRMAERPVSAVNPGR